MLNTVFLLIIEIILLVTGQVLWKTGVAKIGSISLNNILVLAGSLYVWAGIIIYGIATLIWMVILSRANLSTVYPMQSLAYVLGVAAGIFIFGEKVSITGWMGLFLIITGVFLTSGGLK